VLLFILAWSNAARTDQVYVEDHQIVYKKQTDDPAASNSDTFVDSTVIAIPIHIDQAWAINLVHGPL